MPIAGFNITKLFGEKKGKIKVDTQINSSLKLTKVEEQTKNKKEDPNLIKFSFDFDVEYGDIGEIKVSTHTLFVDEESKVKEILKEFKDKKSIPVDLKAQIYNHALYMSSIKALILSQDLGLPPHIKLPYVEPKKD